MIYEDVLGVKGASGVLVPPHCWSQEPSNFVAVSAQRPLKLRHSYLPLPPTTVAHAPVAAGAAALATATPPKAGSRKGACWHTGGTKNLLCLMSAVQ